VTLPLQLEYICTDAEMREAQTLNIRRQYGGGARWRSLLIMFLVLGGLLTLAYFRIRDEVAPQYRPWFLAAVVVLFFFFYYQQVYSRKKPSKPTKMEISSQGITIINDAQRLEVLWSGFSQCLESPNLFALLDRPKGILLIFPKRAFPDEAAREWFRTRANQPPNPAASTMATPFQPAKPQTDGIVLNYQLGYLDLLNRTVSSWRMRGIALLLYAASIVICLYQGMQPDPQRVNSTAKVLFVFMLPIETLMLTVMCFVLTFVWWRAQIKYLGPRQIVLGNDGIEFASEDGRGILPWTTYACFMENRWSFFVWKPKTLSWDMYPKRAFGNTVEVERVRDLLKLKLKPSRWFFI